MCNQGGGGQNTMQDELNATCIVKSIEGFKYIVIKSGLIYLLLARSNYIPIPLCSLLQ